MDIKKVVKSGSKTEQLLAQIVLELQAINSKLDATEPDSKDGLGWFRRLFKRGDSK